MPEYILNLGRVDPHHTEEVGNQSFNLSELIRQKIPLPGGFIIRSAAYDRFFKENNLDQKTKHLINSINFRNPHSITQVSKLIQKHFLESTLPFDIKTEIYNQYRNIESSLKDPKVSLRPSNHSDHHGHTAQGDMNLSEKIKECWALDYDENHLLIGFKNPGKKNYPNTILIQKMIDPERSGKIYTQNPFKNKKNEMLIKAVYGVFENKVNLNDSHDEYEINKSNLQIIAKQIFTQTTFLNPQGKREKVLSNLKKRPKLDDDQIIEIAKLAKKVEEIYYFPQEIDWAIEKNQIYLNKIRTMTNFHYSIQDQCI